MAFSPRQIAAAATIAVGIIAPWEGLSLHAVHDNLAGGLPTVCYGMTKYDRPVKMGDTYTKAQCEEFLIEDVKKKYITGLDKCITVPVTDHQLAAATSAGYNLGDPTVCRSTFVKRLNAKDPHACDYLIRYDRAGGRIIPGLINRRHAEIKICYTPDVGAAPVVLPPKEDANAVP